MNKRPSPPITVWPLAFVACAGLVAQFLAARSAFNLITDSAWQSVAAALLIEAATVTEALVFVRSGNRWAAGGLGLTMAVSATYNYTQASTTGAALGQWQLIAMSVGPLAALVSVGLALGDELRKYESALVEWQTVQDEISQEAASALRRVTIQAERQADDQRRWERQLEQQRLQAELERENAAQAARIKEEGLARRRAEKVARQAEKKNVNDAPRNVTDAPVSPVTPRWRDMTHFLSDADAPDDLKPPDVVELAQVSLRTAQRWLARRAIESRAHSDNGKE